MRRCRRTIKTRLANATVTHTFEKFWEHMRQNKNSGRPPMTEEQRRRRPPVVHPLFMTHPITGQEGAVLQSRLLDPHQRTAGDRRATRCCVICTSINSRTDSATRIIGHENDLLVWDHIGTIHRAIADYRPDEIRLMRRCQVMATKVFDPAFSGLAQVA